VGCLPELERHIVGNVAVAGNMGFAAKLVLRLVAESYMGPARIFLASSLNSRSIVNFCVVCQLGYSRSARGTYLTNIAFG
jgi:hypothetical protein